MEIDNLSVTLKTNGADPAIERIKNLANAVETLANNVGRVSGNVFENFANGLAQIKRAVPTSNQTANMQSFAAAVTEFANAISGVNISQVSNDMSNLSNAVQGMGARSTRTLTNAAQAMHDFSQQAQQAAQNVNVAPNPDNNQQYNTANAHDLLNAFTQINQELNQTADITGAIGTRLRQIGILVPTRRFGALEEQARNIRARYDELRQTMNNALLSGETTPDSQEFQRWSRNLEALRNEYDRLIERQRALAQEGGALQLNPNFERALSGIQQVAGGVKQTFGGVGSVIQTTNGYINTFISKIRSMGSASKKANKDTSSLNDTVKKLSKEFLRLSKMLKLMVTRMALRAVIKELGNGFKSLALHSQEFDDAMSNIINSSKTLGYSISGMLSPLIMALAQPLLTIIQLLTRAINLINQLFSALSGASTWNRAKDFTGKWSDSIKEANGQAKELKKTVLGFDELNQLQDKKTGGKSGADIKDMFETVPIDSKIQDWAKKIQDVANQLFKPIKDAWAKLGTYVKNQWKYAMDEVLKLATKVGKDFLKVWSQRETERIFENILFIIGKIGQTVGNLARQFRLAWSENDTGLHILENIRDLILIITEHIRNMASATADWAGKLNFTPLLTSVNEWLASLKPAFDAIMGVLEDFYEEVVLKFTKWVIESGLPKLIDVFTRFNEEVDWEGLRSKLAELWKHLEPFMETIGEGLIIFIERVTTALKDFVNGDIFADFLDRLGKWMDTVTPEDVADGIERLVEALVAFKIAGAAITALSAVAGIISAIATACSGLASVAGGVSTFVSAIAGLGGAILPIVAVAGIVATAIYSLVQSYGGLEGVIKKIKDTVTSITDSLKKKADSIHLTDKVEKLKEAVGRLGESLGKLKDFWDVLFFVIENVAKGIGVSLMPIIKDLIGFITALIDTVSSIVQVVAGVFEVIVGIFTLDGEKIKQGANDIWEGVVSYFKAGIEGVVSLVKGMIDLVLAPFYSIKYYLVGDPIVIDMWNDITKVFEDGIKKVVDFVGKLKDDVIKFFTDLKSKVDEKINALKTKFAEWSNKVQETKDNIKRSIDEVKSNVTSKLDEMKTKVNEFKSDWAQKWSDAKSKIEEFKTNTSTVLNNIKGDFGTFKDAIAKAFSKESWTFSGVADGLRSTFKSAKEGIGSVWNSIADKLNGEHDIGDSKIRINLPKIYATGGFPEDGLFFANHSELVGRFSNGKTAVANNAQIVEGIERGVYSAVSSAMTNSSGGSQYISNEIIVDGEVIARSITKAQEKMNRRYSPQTV